MKREAHRGQQSRGGENTEGEEEGALFHDFGWLSFMVQPQAQKGKKSRPLLSPLQQCLPWAQNQRRDLACPIIEQPDPINPGQLL